MRPIETYYYSGAKRTYEAMDAEAVVDAGDTGPDGQNIITLQGDAHGFLAGPSVARYNCVYLLGTDNYDGLKRIHAVATNSINIFSSFTAETTATGDTFRTAFTSPFPYNFCGFEVHLNAASATSEDLVIARDSDRSSSFDTKIYSKDMNGVQDITENWGPGEVVPCEADEVIDLTWLNTNSKTWTVQFFIQSRI